MFAPSVILHLHLDLLHCNMLKLHFLLDDALGLELGGVTQLKPPSCYNARFVLQHSRIWLRRICTFNSTLMYPPCRALLHELPTMKGVARLRPRGESGVAAGEAMAPSSKKHAGEGDAAMGAVEAEAVPGPKLQIQLPRKIGGPAAKGRAAPASSSQRAKGQGEIDILELLLVLLKMA